MLFARHRRAWWAVQPAVAVGSAESCQETGGAIAPHHENPTSRCDGEGRGGGQWRAVLASAGALTPAPAKPAPSWSLTSRLAGVPGWLCVARGVPGPDRTSGLLPLPVASVARKRLRRDLMIAAPLRRAQGQERPGPDPIAPLPVGRCRRLHTAYRRPGEAARGSQSRPGRTSGRRTPWVRRPRRRDRRAAKEDGAEPDGPSVERRRALARDLDAGRRNR